MIKQCLVVNEKKQLELFRDKELIQFNFRLLAAPTLLVHIIEIRYSSQSSLSVGSDLVCKHNV